MVKISSVPSPLCGIFCRPVVSLSPLLASVRHQLQIYLHISTVSTLRELERSEAGKKLNDNEGAEWRSSVRDYEHYNSISFLIIF